MVVYGLTEEGIIVKARSGSWRRVASVFWEDLAEEHVIVPLNHAGNRTQRATRLVLRDVYTTRPDDKGGVNS